MDSHVDEYFTQYTGGSGQGKFYKVIRLHESPDVSWEVISKTAPDLPRGWYELCQLSPQDRIDFTGEFWLSKFPYIPNIHPAIAAFFRALEDVGVFLTQRKFDDPYQSQMIYRLSQNRGFYRGFPNASQDNILQLQKTFPEIVFPEDYFAFLQIHNGFCKATDCTGITGTDSMKTSYDNFQALIERQGQIATRKGQPINPKSLIPFYESFGMPFYQCFWNEWHPGDEMGNVYYSGSDNTISEVPKQNKASIEQMAFPTFSEWLAFYLEQVD